MKGLFIFSICLKWEFLKNMEVQEVVMEVQEESLSNFVYPHINNRPLLPAPPFYKLHRRIGWMPKLSRPVAFHCYCPYVAATVAPSLLQKKKRTKRCQKKFPESLFLEIYFTKRTSRNIIYILKSLLKSYCKIYLMYFVNFILKILSYFEKCVP